MFNDKYKIEDEHLEIYDDVEVIDENMFMDNHEFNTITMPNSVVNIMDYAFYRTYLEEIIIPDSVKHIGNSAFENSQLTYVEIPDSVEYIGNKAFKDTQIDEINLPNSIKYIGDSAFYDTYITDVIIPDSVEYLGDRAFLFTNLRNVKLSNNIKIIKKSTFHGTNLTSIEIPNNIRYIDKLAFAFTKIKNVVIPESVKYLGDKAFMHTPIEKIIIPKNINYIGEDLISNELIVNNKVSIICGNEIINNKFISKYGTENIANIYKWKNVLGDNYNFKNIEKSVISNTPLDSDSIKQVSRNVKYFDKLYISFSSNSEEQKDIFKFCFILGLFSENSSKQQEIYDLIEKILIKYDIDDIHQAFTAIKLKKYDNRFSKTFLYLLNNYDFNDIKNIIQRLYNEYDKICKYTLTKKKDVLSKLNSKLKKNNDNKLLEEYEQLKLNLKTLSYDDILYYIKNNTFYIKDGMDELSSIVDTLSMYITQEQFDELQDIYSESLKLKDNDSLFGKNIDKIQDKAHYFWSPSYNPTNLILGYICNCCAKYDGAGFDIMIQSMTNKYIKNLIIYDSCRKIIGKSTAFYNKKEKYILFNNIEMSESFLKSKNISSDDKMNALDAFLRACKDQAQLMNDNNEEINEIRVGMLRNDLQTQINLKNIKINKNNLLKNYNYKDYEGDANDYDCGQALIYKR